MRKKTRKKAKKNKVGSKHPGRPERYNASYADQARKACKNGFNDKQLAEMFGVANKSVIYKWKQKHPEFAKAIRKGREKFAAGEVELSFRQLALPHDEVTQIHELRGRGKRRKMTLVAERVKKKVVNIRAAERVLKTHMPEKYGDKPAVGVNAESIVDILALVRAEELNGKQPKSTGDQQNTETST